MEMAVELALVPSAKEAMDYISVLPKLFPHSIGELLPFIFSNVLGHHLGIDVHDVSSIGSDAPLRPNMVVTVEPGIYIPNSPEFPAE